MKRVFAISVDSDLTEEEIYAQLQELAAEVDAFYRLAKFGASA